MNSRLTSRGFTLIELLVVIAIIGILSSVVLASLSTARAKSRDARRIADIDQLRTALEVYFDSNSSYPNNGSASAGTQDWDTVAPTSGGIASTTPSAIARIPASPANTFRYYYCPKVVASSTTCDGTTSATSITAYVLGADLERSDNAALKSDADVVGAAGYIYGDDNKKCSNNTGGYCFDLTN